MQNKHQKIFLVLGVPNFGEGGSTWLDQIPKFFQKLDLKASLRGRFRAVCLSVFSRKEKEGKKTLIGPTYKISSGRSLRSWAKEEVAREGWQMVWSVIL